MALTPLDVRKQHFRRVMRGVDGDEVAVFLGLVAGEMETLIRERAVLAEQVTALRTRVDEYQSLERSLRDAVVVAQGMREEARRQAERETELLLSKADLEVKGRLRNAESRLADLRRELAELKGERQNYLIRLRALIETHMRMVEASEARFEALDSAGSTDARAETLWRARPDHAALPASATPDGPAAPAPPIPAGEPQHPPTETPGPWG